MQMGENEPWVSKTGRWLWDFDIEVGIDDAAIPESILFISES